MNNARKRNLRTAGLLVLSGLIMGEVGCAVNPVSGRPELTLISATQEQKLGAEEAKKVEEGMGFADDSGFTPVSRSAGPTTG